MRISTALFSMIYFLSTAYASRNTPSDHLDPLLNPLLRPVVDPALYTNRLDPELPYNLIRIYEDTLFTANTGIQGIFASRNELHEDKKAREPLLDHPNLDPRHSYPSVLETQPEDPYFYLVSSILEVEKNFKLELACKKSKMHDFVVTSTTIENKVDAVFQQLLFELKKDFLLKVFPRDVMEPAPVFPSIVLNPFDTYMGYIVGKLRGVINCIHNQYPGGTDYWVIFNSFIGKKTAQATSELLDYVMNLQNIVGLVRDLPHQYALAVREVVRTHLEAGDYDIDSAEDKIRQLTEGHFYLIYKFNVDKSNLNNNKNLIVINEDVARLFSDALVAEVGNKGDLKGPSRGESFLISLYTHVLEALNIDMDIKQNLVLIWKNLLGPGRRPLAPTHSKAIEVLEKRLVDIFEVAQEEKTMMMAMGSEILFLAPDIGSLSQFSVWKSAYLSRLREIGPSVGVAAVQLSSVSKILLANLFPATDENSIEEGGILRRAVLTFLKSQERINQNIRDFPRLFDQFLDKIYEAGDKEISQIYPFAKLFNLWACNTKELLPQIKFKSGKRADQTQRDKEQWFTYLRTFDGTGKIKQFLVSLQVSRNGPIEVQSWDNSNAMDNLLAAEVTWEAARTYDQELADYLDVPFAKLGTGKITKNRLLV